MTGERARSRSIGIFAALVVHRISRDRFLYAAHGAHMEVSNAGLSKAHAARPADIYLDILNMVMEAIAHLPHHRRMLRDVDLDTIKDIRELLTQVSIYL